MAGGGELAVEAVAEGPLGGGLRNLQSRVGRVQWLLGASGWVGVRRGELRS